MTDHLNIYTVSLFGHRYIENIPAIETNLETTIKGLIQTKEYVDFLVGRNGDFDILAASAVRRAKNAFDYGNSSLTLVLPYMTAEYRDNEKYFHQYYDEVEICAQSVEAHYKAAIGIRNRTMIDRSDLVICYIDHKAGGAYNAIKYAVKQKKNILNLKNAAPDMQHLEFNYCT